MGKRENVTSYKAARRKKRHTRRRHTRPRDNG